MKSGFLPVWVKVSVGAVAVLMLWLFFLNFKTITNYDDTEKDDNVENKKMSKVFSPVLPDTLMLAGEIVPLDSFDVRESLDYEVIITCYRHSRSLWIIKKAQRYFDVIEPILKEEGVPNDFKYLAVAESNLMNATSSAGAKGVWQFMKATAKSYKLEVNAYVDERYNLEKSTRAACKYLKNANTKYKSWALAAASYNLGQGNLDKQIKKQRVSNYYDLLLNPETGRYVYNILAYKIVMENPKLYGFDISDDEKYPVIPVTKVVVDSTVNDLVSFAKNFGINYKMLKYFNPWLRDKVLPNASKKKYSIIIPKKGYRDMKKLRK